MEIEEKKKTFSFDIGDESGMGPGHVGDGPVGGRARPHARALERRRDLHHEPLTNAQLHLGRVGHHFHDVAIGRLVASLTVNP